MNFKPILSHTAYIHCHFPASGMFIHIHFFLLSAQCWLTTLHINPMNFDLCDSLPSLWHHRLIIWFCFGLENSLRHLSSWASGVKSFSSFGEKRYFLLQVQTTTWSTIINHFKANGLTWINFLPKSSFKINHFKANGLMWINFLPNSSVEDGTLVLLYI